MIQKNDILESLQNEIQAEKRAYKIKESEFQQMKELSQMQQSKIQNLE